MSRTHRFAPQLTVLEDRLTPATALASVNAAGTAAGRVPGFGATVLANFGVSGMNRGALVSVAATNADGDRRADLAVGSGAGQASSVKVYLGTSLSGTAKPASTSFDPFGTIALNGVFVG